MANNTIQLKRSTTSTNVPLASQLQQGELAINLADRRLFTKDGSNTVIDVFGQSVNTTANVTFNNATINGTLNRSPVVTTTLTGDLTGSGSATLTNVGSNTVTIATTLANTAVAPGTYGNSTYSAVVTVDSKGRVTSATNVILAAASYVTNFAYTASNTTHTISLANGQVLAATIPEANNTVRGVAYVVDSVANTNTTVAASANSVKTAYDAAIAANTRAASAQTSSDTAYTNAVSYADTWKAPKANPTFTGTMNAADVNISGNLTVSGTFTNLNASNLVVGDNIITLNADLGAAAAPTENAGFEVNRGSSANVSFYWDETNDRWTASPGNVDSNYFTITSNTYSRSFYTSSSGVSDQWGTPAAPGSFMEIRIGGGVNRVNTSNRDFYISNTASDLMVISAANGNVGIANNVPAHKLSVNGTFAAGNTIITGSTDTDTLLVNSGAEFIANATVGLTVSRDGVGSSQAMSFTESSGGHYITALSSSVNPKGLIINADAAGNTSVFAGIYLNSAQKLIVAPTAITANADTTIKGFANVSGKIISNLGGADANTVGGIGLDVNSAVIRVGDGLASLAMANGTGIKIGDSGNAHKSIGQLGKNFIISETSSDQNSLFPASRTDLLVANTLQIYLNGNVGVGNTAPTHKLSVNGTGYFLDGVTFANTISVAGNASLDTVQFATTPSNAGGVARLQWNDTEGTLDLGLKGGNVTLQVGQEQHFRIMNQTGATIPNGKVVGAAGAVGASGRIKGALYTANSSNEEMYLMGIATEDVADGSEGFVTQFGSVRGIDTSGTPYGEVWADGDVLYASPTVAGGLTKVLPTSPNLKVVVAMVVRAHASTGTLFVRPTPGSHFRELHDVNISSVANNDFVQYDAVNSRWTNRSAPVISGSLTVNNTASLGNTTITGFANVSSTLNVVGAATFANTLAVTGLITGTITSANNADYLDGQHGTYYTTDASTKAATAYSNAVAYAASNTYVNTTFAPKASPTFTGTLAAADVTISGNLTVSGTTTYINTTTLNIGDNIVTLNADLGGAVAPTENAGIEVNRGSSANVSFYWDETNDYWAHGNTYANGTLAVTGTSALYDDLTIHNASDGTTNKGIFISEFRTDLYGAFVRYHAVDDKMRIGTRNGTTTDIAAIEINRGSSGITVPGLVTASGGLTTSDAWDANTGADSIYLNGATGNRIDWNNFGAAAPAVTTRSVGTKLMLNSQIGAAAVDYAIGIEANHMWFSVPTTSTGFKWYANTTNIITANTNGVLINNGSLTIGSGGSYTYGSIFSDSNWGMLFRSRTSSPGAAHFAWKAYDDTELMRIDSAGRIGISGAPLTGEKFVLTGTTESTATVRSNYNRQTISSGVTSDFSSFISWPTTQAAAFTLPALYHFVALGQTPGSGSTITNQYGFHAFSNLTGATNNYGFYSNIASGTGRWNFYAAGSATNYFAGNTGIGSSSINNRLDVQGGVTSLSRTTLNAAMPALDAALYSGINTNSTATPQLAFISDRADRYSAIGTYRGASSSVIGLSFFVSNNVSTPTEAMRIDEAGRVGIGGSPFAGANFVIPKTATGATNSYQLNSDYTVASDVTSSATTFFSYVQTQAAAFTLGNLNHFVASQRAIGAGSTVTSQVGFRAESTLTGATNNYGFYSNIASGTGRWNFYAAGTADNYFAGNVGIGTTTPDSSLTVSRTGTAQIRLTKTAGTNQFIDIGTGGGGDNHFVYGYGNYPLILGANNSEQVRIAANGAIGVGTTAPAGGNFKLHISGAGSLISNGPTSGYGYWQFGISATTTNNWHIGSENDTTFRLYNGNLGSGTERLRIHSEGRFGFNTALDQYNNFAYTKTATGATTQYGITAGLTAASDVTSMMTGFTSSLATAASAFTLSNLYHYAALYQTIGAGSTVTNQMGFYVASGLTGATNNYGFRSDIASGTGRWNFYAAGSAANYFAGRIAVGDGTDVGASVFVNTGLSTASASGIRVQNSYNLGVSTASQFISMLYTGASAALSSFKGYQADQGTIGVGSTVTNQYGFIAESTLTGATNNYGFYSNIASGTGRWNFYANGSADNYFAGRTGFGSTVLFNYGIRNALNISGAAFATGIGVTSAVQSDVTTSARGFYSNLSTQATSFTLSNLLHYYAEQTAFGAGSTVTNQYGFAAEASLTGATNNYGFYSNIASGTGRWNFYAAGSADNYFAGNVSLASRLLLGSTTSRVSAANVQAYYQQHGLSNDASAFTINDWQTIGFGGPFLNLVKSKGGAVGTRGVVAANERLGIFSWQGDDGTSFIAAAQIEAYVDGTPGTNDMPGRLVFSTTADGASSPTERMRIDSNGSVGVGQVPNGFNKFVLGGTLPSSSSASTGYDCRCTTPSTSTSASIAFNSLMSTQAAAFTLSQAIHFRAEGLNVGAGSSVTHQYGFFATSNLTGATNNYGFRSDIASGTGRWNFYAAGTADNYFAGNVGIGTTTPNNALHVVKTGFAPTTNDLAALRVEGNWGGGIVFSENAARSSIFSPSGQQLAFAVNGTSAGMTEAVRIVANTNVGIGTSSPSYKLHVNGSFAATTKSFVIDHPTKPGKKLRYGSLEGPENGVYVRGKLQGNVIELPEYWMKLVDSDSITVQLTPIGKHQKLYVEDIRDNKVYVGNDGLFAGTIKCFYYIMAERCDVEKLEVEID